MTITKRQAQKWANALRSGKYKQTTGVLQDHLGYCCLGVACDIFIPAKEQLRDDNNYLEGGLPRHQVSVPEWLRDINTDLERKLGTSFSAANDSYGYSFDEIADIIELVYVHKAI